MRELFVLFAAGLSASAAPVIATLANAASNITFNSPIALGSIFVIKGSGLGPANLTIAAAPFQAKNLGGTSIAVTVGTTTVDALMYYTSDKQVAALLPSNTPTGSATFTVTYNGQASNAMGRNIIQANLGVFTVDSSGRGPAIVTFPDYSLVSSFKATPCGGSYTSCGAANPGDTLILWATGLGPVTGNDAAGAGLGQAMPNVPLTLWLGGVQAPVVYQGRSGCCVGEDQIVFTVPKDVPTGCAVPLVAQIGNAISNSTLLPVASGSRNCAPSETAVAALKPDEVLAATSSAVGDINLYKGPNNSGTGPQDMAYFEFVRYTLNAPGRPFLGSAFDEPPPGTCIVYNSSNPENDTFLVSAATELDGGSSVTLAGPNGSVNLKGPNDDYVVFNDKATFLGPGSFTVSGAGGKDIGPFNATLTIPTPASLVSPANAAGLTVTRADGLTVTWTGGDAGSTVSMLLQSATDNTGRLSATASCKASAAAKSFKIPPYVLLALPANGFTSFNFGSMGASLPFTAQGLTFGVFHAHSDNTTFGGFALK